jgi:hypothetical protein
MFLVDFFALLCHVRDDLKTFPEPVAAQESWSAAACESFNNYNSHSMNKIQIEQLNRQLRYSHQQEEFCTHVKTYPLQAIGLAHIH